MVAVRLTGLISCSSDGGPQPAACTHATAGPCSAVALQDSGPVAQSAVLYRRLFHFSLKQCWFCASLLPNTSPFCRLLCPVVKVASNIYCVARCSRQPHQCRGRPQRLPCSRQKGAPLGKNHSPAVTVRKFLTAGTFVSSMAERRSHGAGRPRPGLQPGRSNQR